MIISCEECGKKYRIDPSKASERGMKFNCKACNHVITISKPETRPPDPKALIESEAEVGAVKTETPSAEPEEKPEKRVKLPAGGMIEGKKGRFGLRSKMILLFFVLPIIIVAAAGILYLQQMSTLSVLLTEQSSETVKKMAEDLVKEKARSASKQMNLYLSAHPELNREDFNYEMNLRLIAVQKVGLTGYTSLYSIPDEQGLSTFWMHPNAKLIGINTTESMQKTLGKDFKDFIKIYQGAYKGVEAEGYYLGKDADGKSQAVYMVSSPVEGTPFVLAATVFLDELIRPTKVMETRAQQLIGNTKYIMSAIIMGTILLIGLIVSIYGHLLVTKIKLLTDLAQKISIGDLDTEVEIKSKDEIGDLHDAIVRMQESIRLSMERLRRRRK